MGCPMVIAGMDNCATAYTAGVVGSKWDDRGPVWLDAETRRHREDVICFFENLAQP